MQICHCTLPISYVVCMLAKFARNNNILTPKNTIISVWKITQLAGRLQYQVTSLEFIIKAVF